MCVDAILLCASSLEELVEGSHLPLVYIARKILAHLLLGWGIMTLLSAVHRNALCGCC